MKNRTVYSIFFLLGLIVIVMVYVSYRYIKIPSNPLVDIVSISTEGETSDISQQKYMKNSWLGHIQDAKDQKSYMYAVHQRQIGLN